MRKYTYLLSELTQVSNGITNVKKCVLNEGIMRNCDIYLYYKDDYDK